MGWTKLRDNRLIYIDREAEGKLHNAFCTVKKINPMDLILKNDKIKKEYYSFVEGEVWFHIEAYDNQGKHYINQYYQFEDAQKEIYEWLWAFCETHRNYKLGKEKDGIYYVPANVDIDLSTSFGSKFYLLGSNQVKNGLRTQEYFSDIYTIDLAKLVAISGSLNQFMLLFQDGLIYNVEDSVETGFPYLARIVTQNSSEILYQFFDNHPVYSGLFDVARIPHVPIPFESFMSILKAQYEFDDNVCGYKVLPDGTIDIGISNPYHTHPMYKIMPDGVIFDVSYEKNEQKHIPQSLFSEIVQLIDLPKK